MGDPEVHQVVKGGHNLFTGIGDIYIKYELPPVEADERRVLLQLVFSVKNFWIDSFLQDSLHEAVMLDLPKESLPDMVQHPWGRILELPGHLPQPLAAEKKIDEIFNETGRALLILGEPGAGKTVTLLKLASELIGRFETDPMQAAPVVLNLSTWQDKFTLATWIEAELKSKYFVSPGRSRAWLESSRLILLLDGLDEVPADRRPSCVHAINEFDRGLPGIVVCSRLTEYIALPKRLNFKGAVCLQPLTVVSPIQTFCPHNSQSIFFPSSGGVNFPSFNFRRMSRLSGINAKNVTGAGALCSFMGKKGGRKFH